MNKDNKVIQLDQSFSKSGGEGQVTLIKNSQALYGKETVAKEYFKTPDQDKKAKISYMTSVDATSLLDVTAWPIDAIFEKQSKQLVGYIMPYTGAREPIHNLYTPTSRMKHFPRANWKFLLFVAVNVARAFSKVHKAGHLIGDVNHSNILVGTDSKVVLIDTDSFQVRAPKKTYLCDVGVKDYLPPELFGKNLKQVVRSQNHDNFSLSIILFQILFLGRHPFMGRMTTGEDVSLEAAVERLLYAFSSNARGNHVQPPPPHMSFQSTDLPRYVSDLFERSFSKKCLTSGRPSASEWATSLDKLRRELVECTSNSNHHHAKGMSCAFCRLDQERIKKNRSPIFGTPTKGKSGGLLRRAPQKKRPIRAPQKVSPLQGTTPLALSQLAPEAEFHNLSGVIGPETYVERLKQSGGAALAVLVAVGLLDSGAVFLGLLGPAAWLGMATIQRVKSLGWAPQHAAWMLLPGVNVGLAIYLAMAKRKM